MAVKNLLSSLLCSVCDLNCIWKRRFLSLACVLGMMRGCVQFIHLSLDRSYSIKEWRGRWKFTLEVTESGHGFSWGVYSLKSFACPWLLERPPPAWRGHTIIHYNYKKTHLNPSIVISTTHEFCRQNSLHFAWMKSTGLVCFFDLK